jgi:hypothetical protein
MLNRMSHVTKSTTINAKALNNESQSFGRGLLIAATTSAALWAAFGAVVFW